MAVLRALKGLHPGQVFPLDVGGAVLGRHPECDIVLDIGAVSRQHARVFKDRGEYFVQDLNSRNGTFVNDVPVEGDILLGPNDRLRICDMVFVFHPGATDEAYHRPVEEEENETATLMFHDDTPGGGSTVMSRVDISTGASGLRLAVNAEVKLKALLEIGQHLGKTLDLSSVLHKLLDSLFSIFVQADRGFVILKDRKSGQLIPKAVKHRVDEHEGPMRVSRTILRRVMESKEAILSADAASDSQFNMVESIVDLHIHSIMCAPLLSGEGDALGVIQIDALRKGHRFNREDLEVLASVACQAAVSVENAQLHELAVQERVMDRELALAHEVQQGFLPAHAPEVPGYEFYDVYEPANQLGGDFFTYVWLPEGRLAVVLADVSGKGISAALLVARLSAETRYCLASEPTTARAVAKMNRVFCENRWEGRFVTFIAVVVEPQSHQIEIVNAGHMAPLKRAATGVVPLGQELGGLPLGVDRDAEYEPHVSTLEAGESLTLYTDGVTDAKNPAGEFFGTERLIEHVAEGEPSVIANGRKLLDRVRRYIGSQAQTDDLCVVSFGRTVE